MQVTFVVRRNPHGGHTVWAEERPAKADRDAVLDMQHANASLLIRAAEVVWVRRGEYEPSTGHRPIVNLEYAEREATT